MDGSSVGEVVGHVVGSSVGETVGALVGFGVGLFVGATVGVFVGLLVGLTVGSAVGLPVGRVVTGLAVGLTVGHEVTGLSVGLDDVGALVGADVSFKTTRSSSAVAKPSTPSSRSSSSAGTTVGASEGALVTIDMVKGVGRKVGSVVGLRVGKAVGLKVGALVVVGEAVTGASVVGAAVTGALVGAAVMGLFDGCFVAAYRIFVASSIITEDPDVSSSRSLAPAPGPGEGGKDGPKPGGCVGGDGDTEGPVASSHLSVNPPSLLKESRHGSMACTKTCAGNKEGHAIARHRIARHCLMELLDAEARIL